MEFPGMGFGKKPSVFVSNSESVSGSVSHEGTFFLERAVTDADAGLAAESAIPFLFATAENVYETPAVSSLIVHSPLAPVTMQVFPPGEEVTMYELGVGPEVGWVTAIVALSIPATTVSALVALKRIPAFEVLREKVNDAESCPLVSCSAALFSVLSTAGAVYVTDAVVDV